jgi:hypothetical protein
VSSVLTNELYENPVCLDGNWVKQDDSFTWSSSMLNSDGSTGEGLWAESWEEAKTLFRSMYELVSDIDANTVQSITRKDPEENVFWHCLFPSELEN